MTKITFLLILLIMFAVMPSFQITATEKEKEYAIRQLDRYFNDSMNDAYLFHLFLQLRKQSEECCNDDSNTEDNEKVEALKNAIEEFVREAEEVEKRIKNEGKEHGQMRDNSQTPISQPPPQQPIQQFFFPPATSQLSQLSNNQSPSNLQPSIQPTTYQQPPSQQPPSQQTINQQPPYQQPSYSQPPYTQLPYPQLPYPQLPYPQPTYPQQLFYQQPPYQQQPTYFKFIVDGLANDKEALKKLKDELDISEDDYDLFDYLFG